MVGQMSNVLVWGERTVAHLTVDEGGFFIREEMERSSYFPYKGRGNLAGENWSKAQERLSCAKVGKEKNNIQKARYWKES